VLTADLVRLRSRNGRVVPRFVAPDDPTLVEASATLCALFAEHVGDRVGALEEAIADHIGDGTDYLVWRGLTKLLTDRATIEVRAARPPSEVRAAVFREAAASWPVGPAEETGLSDRDAVLARAAAALGLTPAEVDEALYADLASEARLVAVDLPDTASLIDRYNLALAQAALLRAREVVITLPRLAPARARQLFRALRFRQLMWRAERQQDGWRLTLDGPLSLFRHTQRYGLQLALFLPALCHLPEWSLEADIVWGERRRPALLALDHTLGLRSHTQDLGAWESDEERHLRASWKKSGVDWTLRRATELIDLDGQDALVPDYVLVHPDGRRVLLDIVWFWRRQTFERRLDLLRRAGPPNLIVALATRLRADAEELPELPAGAIYPFKGVIVPKRLCELAESLGR
jgi:predicted nuclease of restriction endonuclease-like RecB superfamily